jgi:co-chaperonin GroES (HSP10)
MNIVPQHSWILVKPEQRATQLGSVIVPLELNAEVVGYAAARVVATPAELWPKSIEADVPTPTPFSVGDRVLYRRYLKDIHTVEVNGEEHCLLHWEDILAVLSDDCAVGFGS